VEKSKKIFAEALLLSPIERAALIEELFSSFTYTDRISNDVVWAKEVESRINAYDAGELTSAPADEVFRRLNRNSKPC